MLCAVLLVLDPAHAPHIGQGLQQGMGMLNEAGPAVSILHAGSDVLSQTGPQTGPATHVQPSGLNELDFPAVTEPTSPLPFFNTSTSFIVYPLN